jgi:hypothetical protein
MILLYFFHYRMYEERMLELDKEVEMINDGNVTNKAGHS